MLDLYDAATRVGFEGTDELRSAGRAAAAGAALAVVLGCGAALIGRRRASSPARHARLDRAVAVGAIALAVAAVAGFAVATERPIGWIGDRFDEFLTQGTPEAGGASSRFSANAGSERDDLWRVALSDAGDDPILGLGGGGFQYSYLQDRSEEGIPSVRDAHSVELEVLSELGVPGLILLGVALVGAIGGAAASMGARAESAALGAAALTAGTYWLAHASIDWFWAYPAVTAPVFALLGAACKVGPPAPEGAVPGRWRVAAVAGVVVLAVSLIPPFLSERYVDAAYGGWRVDPERAWSDLERARDLNPLSIEPLLAEGGIARALGDRPRAIAAFEEAADERPEEWAAHYFIAELSQNVDRARARAAIERARELKPLSARVRALSRRVESASPRP
jgi:hypothetical protein